MSVVVIHGERVRATVPAIEAILVERGNRVAVGDMPIRQGAVMAAAQHAQTLMPDPYAPECMVERGWTVWMVRPPAGLVAVHVQMAHDRSAGAPMTALREDSDPPWPGEMAADGWTSAAWTVGCPGPRGHPCGSVLIWAEAGYVPGWRVCLRGHFAFLRHAAGVGTDVVTYEGRIHDASQYPRRPRIVYEIP